MKLYTIIALASIIGLYIATLPKDKSTDTELLTTNNIVYCAPSFDSSRTGGDAPLLQGLGNLSYKVSTRSQKAQQYFNQGLALTYAFNHSEAARSFNTAIRLDSTFAMAYWGLAMVLGPNYNAALNPTSLDEINAAIKNATKYSGNTSAAEKALINAISVRFPKTEVADMTPFYESYAHAMKKAHEQFPSDMNIATIYADALMNLHPWNLWLKDGTAQPWTKEIVNLIEKILEQDPNHPGAIHYYIHAMEASKQAGKALPYADRLRDAMPAAGHLVHMPSHIYIRTGDYHKGVIANEKASAGDSIYIQQCRAQGFYPLLLYPHNIHFLAACAFFEGNSHKALDAAWMVSRKADRRYLESNITVQHFYIIPYYMMIHMGKWNAILNLQHPGEQLKYPAAIWHYARGMAYAAKGQRTKALIELKAVKQFAADESLQKMLIWDMNNAQSLVQIAAYILEGEILAYDSKYKQAIDLFRKAIAIEDQLAYTEPPDWFFSGRLTLGHWLVQANEMKLAEKVYREDLETFPENGWALMGLYNSLAGQGRTAEAKFVKQRFDKAWAYSDMIIVSSRKF